jgi:hypothetical protein
MADTDAFAKLELELRRGVVVLATLSQLRAPRYGYELRQALVAHTSQVNVWMLNISRGTDQLERLRFAALSPAFLIAATKS